MESKSPFPVSASSVLTLVVTSWLIYSLTTTFISYLRLRHVKGPFLASVSPLWLFYHTLKGDVYLACEKGLRKYGSPLRIGPNMIASDDPALQRFMASPKSPFIRGHWFKGMKFDPRVDNVLSTTDEKHHADLRNRLIPGYTGKEVTTLEKDVDTYVVGFLEFIQQYANQGKSFDLARAVSFFTMDVLTQIAFGKALGYLSKNEDVFNYLQSSQDFYPIMELGSNHPTIFRILKSPLMAGAQPKPTDKVGFGAIVGHTAHVISERYNSDAKEHHDMIGSFVRHGLTQEEVESESLLQILAGSDSTATALRCAFCFIMTSPYVCFKLLEEIKEAIASNRASRPVIKHSEAQALPYLQAVIKETTRIFMPLQGLAGRLPPKGGTTVNGLYIPEGTEVGFAMYAMLRREDLFGSDADTFRPERWIDNDRETIQRMSRDHELVFGSGRSSCLGKNTALMELGKAIFETFNAFDLTIVNSFRPMSVRSNSVVVQKDFFVRAYPRA